MAVACVAALISLHAGRIVRALSYMPIVQVGPDRWLWPSFCVSEPVLGGDGFASEPLLFHRDHPPGQLAVGDVDRVGRGVGDVTAAGVVVEEFRLLGEDLEHSLVDAVHYEKPMRLHGAVGFTCGSQMITTEAACRLSPIPPAWIWLTSTAWPSTREN